MIKLNIRIEICFKTFERKYVYIYIKHDYLCVSARFFVEPVNFVSYWISNLFVILLYSHFGYVYSIVLDNRNRRSKRIDRIHAGFLIRINVITRWEKKRTMRVRAHAPVCVKDDSDNRNRISVAVVFFQSVFCSFLLLRSSLQFFETLIYRDFYLSLFLLRIKKRIETEFKK